MSETSFAQDLEFLSQHVEPIVLRQEEAVVAVVPEWQARVATSASHFDAEGNGWLNRRFIAERRVVPHINVFGGEDRFWLGPEGGQFSLFFAKDDPFDLAHWQTPPAIDSEPFEVVSVGPSEADFRHQATLFNYSGARLDLEIERTIRMIPRHEAEQSAGVRFPAEAGYAGYESVNTVRNVGEEPWRRESGLISIWILGMFKPTPMTTVACPYVPGSVDDLGPIVNDRYFGKVPEQRLAILPQAVLFRGDGLHRSKIGLSALRARSILGSWSEERSHLTIVSFSKPDEPAPYVNSMWEIQDDAYGGDVVNSYNDGPAEPGAEPLGPFYELETSSPALALGPGESATHIHRTLHLSGAAPLLDPVAKAALGLALVPAVRI